MKHTSVQGFTLLETLASIAIISLVIVGPLSVLSSSSSYARQTKDVIVSTYLAEEALELLQNQYDSLYIYCKKSPNATDIGQLCEPASALEVTTGQTSWRLFKERLGNVSGSVSCFSDENPNGCAYDTLHMAGDITSTPPTRYDAEDSQGQHCVTLVRVTKQIDYTFPAPGKHIRSSFVCSGEDSHKTGSSVDISKSFSRSVIVEQLPTFETGSKYDQYYDDLRVTAEVRFRGVNGRTQSSRIVRFMSPRL